MVLVAPSQPPVRDNVRTHPKNSSRNRADAMLVPILGNDHAGRDGSSRGSRQKSDLAVGHVETPGPAGLIDLL